MELDPASEIVVTASGVQALNVEHTVRAGPGDEALVLTPAWPNGSSIMAMAMPWRSRSHTRWWATLQIDFDALEAAVTPRTRLLLYTSPSNPLGWVATEDDRTAARFHPPARVVADGRRSLRALYYAGAKPDDTGSHHPEEGHARRCGDGGAVILEDLLHDGMARGMAGRAPRSGARATQLNEFIISHAPSFAQRAAETALLWGENDSGDAGAVKGESRFLPRRAGQDAGHHGSQAGRRVLPVSEDRGPDRLVRFLQTPVDGDAVGLAPGVAFGRRRGIRPHLLRRREANCPGSDGAPGHVLEVTMFLK